MPTPACPICAETARQPFNGRQQALCEGCGALERHRALALRFAPLLADGNGRACLEAGPLNRRVFGGFLASRGWEYRSVDRWRDGNPRDPRDVKFITDQLDLCDLSPLASGSFDLFIAQHVIEEVEDFRAALDEIARVLNSGGIALLDIPFRDGQTRSRAHPADRFGNVWEFGTDLLDELRARFGALEILAGESDEYRAPILGASWPR